MAQFGSLGTYPAFVCQQFFEAIHGLVSRDVSPFVFAGVKPGDVRFQPVGCLLWRHGSAPNVPDAARRGGGAGGRVAVARRRTHPGAIRWPGADIVGW